jgi:hypothetical protein
MSAKIRYKKWAVKIQHCPISSKFDMWVDNDVPTLKNFYRSPISNFEDIGQCWIFAVLLWPFWKWRPVEIFQCRETIRDIIRLWCPELIPDIEKFLPVAIFKIAATIAHKFNIVRFPRNFICR